MHSDNEHFNSLIRLILPQEIFDYFEIIKINIAEKEVHVYLDELPLKPDGFENEKLLSKGFHPTSTIQDFPLRDKAVYLHVRRRRWLIESSEQVISRDWDAVAKGTRLTKDFAIFLKGILGRLPNKQ
ncbi:MAG: transposase [Chloroflexia bacterium]|nr:transposase [Chloroflexia bacterium]